MEQKSAPEKSFGCTHDNNKSKQALTGPTVFAAAG